MSNAPSKIKTFIMNMIICIWAIIGSWTARNLCIKNVTGARNSAINHAPALAR